jgi:ankyrin repeat protein
VKHGCNVNFLDEFGKSPIFYASELGQDDTLEILLDAKADPNLQDNELKKTPMHVAVENG